MLIYLSDINNKYISYIFIFPINVFETLRQYKLKINFTLNIFIYTLKNNT